MSLKTTNTRTHVYIGYANPYLVCDTCKGKVPYWHNEIRCGCTNGYFNHPCEHKAGTSSICHSWSPVGGCRCKNKETHDK